MNLMHLILQVEVEVVEVSSKTITNVRESQADHDDVHRLLETVLQSKHHHQQKIAHHCGHIEDEEKPCH